MSRPLFTTCAKPILAFLLLLIHLVSASAQEPPAASAQSTNQSDEAIRAILDRMYNRMATNAPFLVSTNRQPPVLTNPPPIQPVDTNQPAGVVKQPEPVAPTSPLIQTARDPVAPVTNAPIAATTTTTNIAGTNVASQPVPGVTPPGFPTQPGVLPPGVTATPQIPAPETPVPPPTTQPPTQPVPPGPLLPPGVPVPTPTTAPPPDQAAGASTNAQLELFPPGLIKFQETDLLQVLSIYQELTGRTVLAPANLPQTKISITTQTYLTREEAVQALDSILSLNSITMVPQGEKFVKAVQTQQAGTEAKMFNVEKYTELPEAGTFVVQMVKLKNTSPSDVAQALQPFAKNPQAILGIDASGIVILRDNAENVKRMMEVLEQIDVVPIQEYESVVIPIKYALASDIATVLGELTEGGSSTTVGSGGAQGGLGSGGLGGGIGARGTGSLGGGYGGGYNQGYNRSGYGGAGSRGYNPLSQATPVGQRSDFQDRLRGIVNRATQGGGADDITILGKTKIIADERTNSLLIFASKNDIPTIKDIVSKLDVVLPQVLIEAIVMEVALDENWEYGVSWLQKPQEVGNFTGSGVNIANADITQDPLSGTNLISQLGGFRYFGSFGNDLDVALRATASDSRMNVLSKPRIQTSHAVEANLFVGETRPYVTGTYFGGSGFGSTSQYQQLSIGITLSVLPLINADGLVVLDISQQIQNVSGEIEIDGNSVPITAEREARAKVAVRDRETIMIGGFISSDQGNSESGIPVLKDIPLLGFLFKGKSKSDSRRELIILLRPTVLPTPIEAALVAQDEKNRLPGVIAAEKDYLESERKRLDQAQRELLTREGFK